jgi:hypothetical protein
MRGRSTGNPSQSRTEGRQQRTERQGRACLRQLSFKVVYGISVSLVTFMPGVTSFSEALKSL